jgi:Fur family peroxide stress response transcriptional regulator
MMSATVEEFREICSRTGLKATNQRWEVFRQLRNTTGHPDAETVHRRVRKRMPTISLDTVYRTLEAFENVGVAARVTVFGNRTRFDGVVTPHAHAVCGRCGTICDVAVDQTLAIPDTLPGFARIDSVQLEYHGICRECADASTRRD